MHDLRDDLGNLWRTASRLTSREGGRAIMFIAARTGEGTSSVAASAGLLAAARVARSAWLVDLDLRRNEAYRGFEAGFVDGLQAPGRALDASLGQPAFYVVSPSADAEDAAANGKLLTAHQIGGTRLLVTRFRGERLRQGQRVQIRTQPNWWRAARQSADWLVVDAPALDRSAAGLAVASQMDGVVLVISAEGTKAEELQALRLEVEAHGGNVIGVVMNRMRADARMADRFGA